MVIAMISMSNVGSPFAGRTKICAQNALSDAFESSLCITFLRGSRDFAVLITSGICGRAPLLNAESVIESCVVLFVVLFSVQVATASVHAGAILIVPRGS
jgi:hypothetical protein